MNNRNNKEREWNEVEKMCWRNITIIYVSFLSYYLQNHMFLTNILERSTGIWREKHLTPAKPPPIDKASTFIIYLFAHQYRVY